MKHFSTFRQLLLSAALVAVLGLAFHDGVAASERCYDNWSDAAPVVARESLVSARDIHKLVGRTIAAKVIRITLCKSSSGYNYRLMVFDRGGKARKLILDARKPVVR